MRTKEDASLLASFGHALRTERERLQLTQEQAARIAGVSRLAYRRYEKGQRPIDILSLYPLSLSGFDISAVLGNPLSTGAQFSERCSLIRVRWDLEEIQASIAGLLQRLDGEEVETTSIQEA